MFYVSQNVILNNSGINTLTDSQQHSICTILMNDIVFTISTLNMDVEDRHKNTKTECFPFSRRRSSGLATLI